MTTNRITELFNIKYPIIQGGMIWASGHKLVTAVSNAGGLGLIGIKIVVNALSVGAEVIILDIKKKKI